MRAEARGESGTLMAWTPSCASSARAFDLLGAVDAARRNDFDQRDELALLQQRADSGALAERRWRRFGGQLRPPRRLRVTRACASMARMAERMARMWLGVVPQQPPTICAPARWPCARSWPCTPASRDRCCGLRRRAACRHWAWQPAAGEWRGAWPRSRSAPWPDRWSS